MLHFRVLSTNYMTARTLRAACILSLAGAVWASDNLAQPASNAAVQPPPQSVAVPTPNKTRPAQSPRLPAKAHSHSTRPHWSDLTPAQQQALAPLASDWDKLDAFRKQKWLVIANKFHSMKPEEQQRVQNRMRDWAKLTPAQRRAAREAYARAKKLNADQKSAKWQQYQNLPEEEKKRLAAEAEAKRKKRLANLPRSIATKNKAPATARLSASKAAPASAPVKQLQAAPAASQTQAAPSQPASAPPPSPAK